MRLCRMPTEKNFPSKIGAVRPTVTPALRGHRWPIPAQFLSISIKPLQSGKASFV